MMRAPLRARSVRPCRAASRVRRPARSGLPRAGRAMSVFGHNSDTGARRRCRRAPGGTDEPQEPHDVSPPAGRDGRGRDDPAARSGRRLGPGRSGARRRPGGGLDGAPHRGRPARSAGHLVEQHRDAARAARGVRRQGRADRGRAGRAPGACGRAPRERAGGQPPRRPARAAVGRRSELPGIRPRHRQLQLLLAGGARARRAHVAHRRSARRPPAADDRRGDGALRGGRGGARPPAGAGEPAPHRALHHVRRSEPAGRLQQLLPDSADRRITWWSCRS